MPDRDHPDGSAGAPAPARAAGTRSGRRTPPGRRSLRAGAAILGVLVLAVLAALPVALGHATRADGTRAAQPRYAADRLDRALEAPWWIGRDPPSSGRGEALPPDATSPAVPPAVAPGASARSWLGTDRLGRDVLLRSLLGLGTSMLVGASAALVATVLGTAIGLAAGSASPRADGLLMRATDLFYGLPSILLVVVLAMAVDGALDRAGLDPAPGPRRAIELATLLAAIGLVAWPPTARIVRSETRSLRERPFMEATIALGLPWRRRVVRHLLPNLAGPIIVQATLAVPAAVLVESFLGFLGIGVRPPLPSLGVLVAEGLAEVNPVRSRWWLLAGPAFLTCLLLLGLLLLGDGLRARLARR